MQRLLEIGVLALVAACSSLVSAATPDPASLERIACEPDPNQTYAAFLPASYDPHRAHPVVLLMDPRGRAGTPLELFRPGADRLGYILISSYDTSSDGAWEPNEKAVRAMLPDARRRFSIDPKRLYLAGFSGTARAAWDFSVRLRDGVAGVIGFGAGLPSERHPLDKAPPFFGGAGTTDFNFTELRALDDKLDELGAAHRVVFFEGSHAWPPEGVASAALEWMEVQAMKQGLRPRDEALAGRLLEGRLSRARSLDSAGDAYEALREYRSIARDFEGLAPVADAAARAAALEKDRQARKTKDRMDDLAGRERGFQTRLGTFLGQFHVANPPPTVEETLRTLKVQPLQADAKSSDTMLAQMADRMLSTLFVHVSFYEPMDCLSRKDAARAAAFLAVAETLRPEDAGVQVMLARARAQLGQKKEALDALARAAAALPLDPQRLRTDRWLVPLKDEARFQELLASLESRGQS
ncbi:MAG: hypothetical protein ACREAA_11240 [Candidatus Polarisedimenticolia bacterium]